MERKGNENVVWPKHFIQSFWFQSKKYPLSDASTWKFLNHHLLIATSYFAINYGTISHFYGFIKGSFQRSRFRFIKLLKTDYFFLQASDVKSIALLYKKRIFFTSLYCLHTTIPLRKAVVWKHQLRLSEWVKHKVCAMTKWDGHNYLSAQSNIKGYTHIGRSLELLNRFFMM